MFGGGLPHDTMHDILEGVAQYEIKLLIRHCISLNYITPSIIAEFYILIMERMKHISLVLLAVLCLDLMIKNFIYLQLKHYCFEELLLRSWEIMSLKGMNTGNVYFCF